jgi:NADH pyrophosphatase NudC (nudix superfamily)
MDIGSIFLILGLLVIVGLFVSRPFLERRATPVTQEEQQRSALLAERDRILNSLQELDFDHTMGKIPDEDYPTQRVLLLQQGAQILRELDTYQAQPQGEVLTDDAEERIEAAIAARRGEVAVPVSSNGSGVRIATAAPDDDLEVMIAGRRRERKEKAAGFCPQCGSPVQVSDRFCPRCGTTLTVSSKAS